MSKIGRLDPAIRDRALAVIGSGADLAMWEEEDPKSAPKRRAALEKARAQLVGPQSKRKRLRPPRCKTFGLAAGDALALTVPSGLALLRVVRVDTDRTGETLVLEEMQFRSSKLPSQEKLDQLKPKAKGKVDLMGEPRFNIYSSRETIDWERWGFSKAASFAPRTGDETAGASCGVDWQVAAGKLRGDKQWM